MAHLAAWKVGCDSQAAYCRQRGLTQNDFWWWNRELGWRAVVTAPAFVPVQVASLRTASLGFELELRGGRVLRSDTHVDPVALSAVVRELERDAC